MFHADRLLSSKYCCGLAQLFIAHDSLVDLLFDPMQQLSPLYAVNRSLPDQFLEALVVDLGSNRIQFDWSGLSYR
jgi:hypothetical protein